MIKKILIAITISLSLGLGSVPRSQAVVAAVFPPSMMTILHSTLFSLVVLGTVAGFGELGEKHYGSLKGKVWFYITAGLIMDSNSNTIQFQPLSDDDFKKMHLTDNEFVFYNAERNRINALLEEGMLILFQASVENQEAVARYIHEELKSELSPDSLSAIQKIFSTNFGVQKGNL